MKLPRDLKTKINKLAHHAGLIHAEQVKAKLSADTEQRLTAGESFAAINKHLDQPQQIDSMALRLSYNTIQTDPGMPRIMGDGYCSEAPTFYGVRDALDGYGNNVVLNAHFVFVQ